MRETSWDYMLLGALPKNYAIFLKQNRAFQIFHSELSLMCHPLYSESLKKLGIWIKCFLTMLAFLVQAE